MILHNKERLKKNLNKRHNIIKEKTKLSKIVAKILLQAKTEFLKT